MNGEIYSVVETEKESGSYNVVVTDNHLFSSREKAIAYMRKVYDNWLENEPYPFSHDFSEDGWCYVVSNDDTLWEASVSEGLEVDKE